MGLHDALLAWLAPALLLGCALTVLMEAARARPSASALRGWRASAVSAGVLLASAALGHLAVFDERALLAASGIGPLFVGLFGLPTILLAILDPAAISPGKTTAPARPDGGRGDDGLARGLASWGVVVRGTLVGAVVGWFPGTSSGQATMLAVVRTDDGGDGGLDGARRYILGVAAVGTANVVFNLAALATFLRVRSGAAAAVGGLMGWADAPWAGTMPPVDVAALLLALAIGASIAAPLVLMGGRLAASAAPILSGRPLLLVVATALAALCVVPGGAQAAAVLAAATSLGMLPPLLGVMRVHLMGAMTIPVAMALLMG